MDNKTANNSEVFESHWEDADLQQTPASKRLVAKKFLDSSGLEFAKLSKGYRVLDAGCGNGVHAEILHGENVQLDYYGVDISSSAIKHCERKLANWGKFLQADISLLNFPDQYFDLVFCYGVLFYTENPEMTLRELKRVCKDDGVIGLWFMPASSGFGFKVFSNLRKVFSLMPLKVSVAILNLLVPLLFFIPTQSKINLGNASWSECLEVLKVNFIPVIKFQTMSEFEKMLSGSGLQIAAEFHASPITVWLKKLS